MLVTFKDFATSLSQHLHGALLTSVGLVTVLTTIPKGLLQDKAGINVHDRTLPPTCKCLLSLQSDIVTGFLNANK